MWCQIIETEVVTKGLFIIPIRCFTLWCPVRVEIFCAVRSIESCWMEVEKKTRIAHPNSRLNENESIITHNPLSISSFRHETTCVPATSKKNVKDEHHKRQIRCVSNIFNFHNGFSPRPVARIDGNYLLDSVFFSLLADANEFCAVQECLEIGWIFCTFPIA